MPATFPPLDRPFKPSPLPRRIRIATLLALIFVVQGGLAYLLTWIDPPRGLTFVSIRIDTYQNISLPTRRHFGAEDIAKNFASAEVAGTTRQAILARLDALAQVREGEPVVVYLGAMALHADGADVCLLPSDANLHEPATWLPLREVLAKMKKCPAKEKLLILDWSALPDAARLGRFHHDIAAALPRELDAVPDGNLVVLSACAAGQQPHFSAELGTGVFSYYLQEALRGRADGYGGARDRRVSVKEVAAFLRARVDRWAGHNRGVRQTPTLFGAAVDFTLAQVDAVASRPGSRAVPAREYPEAVRAAWQVRDHLWHSERDRLMPVAFQTHQAALLRMERSGALEPWTPGPIPAAPGNADKESRGRDIRKTLEERWRLLDQQLVGARPADVERIKKQFIADLHAEFAPADLDAPVFAHALADGRLDPGMLRLCDHLVHPGANPMPRSAETLRLRQVADLAMRVEVQAWSRDLVAQVLRTTRISERALRQRAYLPGYVELLAEPSHTRHAGEVRLWSPGYSNAGDARRMLLTAAEQFERLENLNARWRKCQDVLTWALAELPWYTDALECLTELREPWRQSTIAARALSEALQETPAKRLPWLIRVERLAEQLERAETQAQTLARHQQALHAPFASDALARLRRQCQSPQGDAQTRLAAEAILSVAAPVLPAEERVALWPALQVLSHRLNDETLALDRKDDDAEQVTPTHSLKPSAPDEAARRAQWQLNLLEMAGLADADLQPLRMGVDQCKRAPQPILALCELGARFRQVSGREIAKHDPTINPGSGPAGVAWLRPLLCLEPGWRADAQARLPMVNRADPMKATQAWLEAHDGYLARDFAGLNLNSPGIEAARLYFNRDVKDQANEKHSQAFVRMKVSSAVEPLSEKQPYAHAWLEVTREVPPGPCGPVELRIHRADDAWLEIAPDAVTLPAAGASKVRRVVTSKVPIKITRRAKAERTGFPPPLGFLVEAIFAGQSWHHLVNVPIVPDTRELQILVSADPDEPTTTLNTIRVRPGNVKQPHYVYLRNLTNRMKKVRVEVRAGDTLVQKSRIVALNPDATGKIAFDDTSASVPIELRSPITVRVLDSDGKKVYEERSLPVEVLSPRMYVQVRDPSYEPGLPGVNKWSAQVQTIKTVLGPAIAARLVLPVERIPGLMGVGGGTLQVELPTNTTGQRTLFAERLNLLPTAIEDGPVYLHIDGVPRAFVYRTRFSRGGAPTIPTVDRRPAVRLIAPPCVMAGVNCLVDLEVDNAPTGTRLEVALGRLLDDGTFKAEVVRDFANAKKQRVGMATTKDALIFDASIGDWTAFFDTRHAVGPRALRARLLDAKGKQIAQAEQSMVIDDSPPIALIAPTPPQVQRGTVLQMKAQGVDPQSGVAQVVFFLGQPEKGEVPVAATRFKAIPANRELTQWHAPLFVPADHKGPLAISVQVVNHAGMASIDTVTVDVTAGEPGKTGLGEIRGIVMEGPRVQPKLLVTLVNADGKEVARTHTLADGTYVFRQLAPGKYRVICVKPESQRRAVVNATVGPDRVTKTNLTLAL
ncbi:MAG: carboxypeptidase regulatory-like domain-containing protein [Planctomycetes bacterium]|nr:carboxypeptidase regulatory-like domain-containing protein [Planctomycetota bacterium]